MFMLESKLDMQMIGFYILYVLFQLIMRIIKVIKISSTHLLQMLGQTFADNLRTIVFDIAFEKINSLAKVVPSGNPMVTPSNWQ